MTKHTPLFVIMLIVAVGLIGSTVPSQAFGYDVTRRWTDYGWNVLKDNAAFYWSFNETATTDLSATTAWQPGIKTTINCKLSTAPSYVAGQSANMGQGGQLRRPRVGPSTPTTSPTGACPEPGPSLNSGIKPTIRPPTRNAT